MYKGLKNTKTNIFEELFSRNYDLKFVNFLEPFILLPIAVAGVYFFKSTLTSFDTPVAISL